MPDPAEIEHLERAAEDRLRRLDASSGDARAAAAAARLAAIAGDLRSNDYGVLWTELEAVLNWLAESDAISDYAALAAAYRGKIGLSETPADGGAYLDALLSIARSLI
jgi:hypothetical protein